MTSNRYQEQLVYIFSSAPDNRPDYKRGVLDALCYPSGHQMELSYRKSYITQSIFNNRSEMAGRQGVFVFLDYKRPDRPDHDFIPIRFVKLLELSPKEQATELFETSRMYIRIELGELIPFDPKWNTEIRALPTRPRISQGKGEAGTGHFYVLEGSPLFPERSRFAQRDIWDHLVERIADVNSLKDCVFLSTSRIVQFKNRRQCKLSSFGRDQKAYRLRPNSIYQMDLRIYDRKHLPDINHVSIQSSSDLITVSQPFITGVGGPTDHSVLIATKRTVESTLATLAFNLQREEPSSLPQTQTSGGSTPISVTAARPAYLISVPQPWVLLACFTIFGFLGFLLTSTSKEFYEDFFSSPEVWALVSKVIGAALLAAAAFLAFRKLPSGGAGG